MPHAVLPLLTAASGLSRAGRTGGRSPVRLSVVAVCLLAGAAAAPSATAATHRSAPPAHELPPPAATYEENRRLLESGALGAAPNAALGEALSLEVRRGDAPVAHALVLAGPERRPIAVTTAQGRATVRVGPEDRPLWVQTPEGRLRAAPTRPAGASPDAPIVVHLPDPATLSGRVRDARSGQALPGAVVWPVGEPWHAATTGDDGAFTVRSWSDHVPPPLRVGAPAYLPEETPIAAPSGRPLEISLHRSVTLAGCVTDPDGEPVAGARVELLTAAAELPLTTESGREGGFAFEGLADGTRADLRVRHPRHATRERHGVEVVAGGAALEVVLQPAARLDGRVIDAEGAAVAGAEVTVRAAAASGAPGQSVERRTESDRAGRFEISWPTAGVVTVEARGPGFRPASLRGIELGGRAAAEEVVLVLQPGATLVGRVLKPDGRGAAGALVSVIDDRDPSEPGPVRAVPADEAGRFALDDLGPGRVTVLADLEGFRGDARRVEVEPGENRLDLRLTPGVELAGRVIDEADAPVTGARVAVVGARPFPSRSSALTGPDGAFRLRGLSPGAYELSAESRMHAPLHRTISVQAGETEPLILRLRSGAVLRGHVLGGRPGDGETGRLDVEIGAVEAAGAVVSGTVRVVAGTVEYSVAGLAPGTWMVVASTRGGARQARATVVVEPGDRELTADLDLGAGHALAGTVRVDGVPLAAARIGLVGVAGQGGADGTTGPDGRFELSGLADGPHRLTVTDERSTVLHEEPVDLAGDLALAIDVSTATVAGTVLDGGGRPLGGVLVGLAREGAPAGAAVRAMTDPEGRFFLPRVAAGAYRVRVAARGHDLLVTSVELAGGGRTEPVVLVVPRGGEADRVP